MVRECTRAMARRHAVKAEEVAHVVAGVVGSGQGKRVGKMADVEAWRSRCRGSQTQSNVPTRANRKGTRAACPSRPSAHPYLTLSTALAKQRWARPRCLGVRESQESSSAPQRGDLAKEWQGIVDALRAITPGTASRNRGPVARGPCRERVSIRDCTCAA